MKKALPKKVHEKKVKQVPHLGVGKKISGSNGKPRYSYPAEKKPKAKKVGKNPKSRLEEGKPESPSLHVDPHRVAKQIGVQHQTLLGIATRFAGNKKLKGKAGFSKFMKENCREFHKKHALGHDYWERLYDSLASAAPTKPPKA